MEKNTKGIIIIVVAVVFILMLRGLMGKTKVGSAILEAGDAYAAFKLIMLLLLLGVGYFTLTYLKKKKDEDKK